MRINTEKIKEELGRIDRSQAWLARQLGVKPQTIYAALNNGARSFSTIERIAEVLKVDPKDLITS